MRLTQWLLLIIFVVTIGCLQVAARNSVLFKGYSVGGQWQAVHAKNTDAQWLNARVTRLSSPIQLAQVAKHQKMRSVIRFAGPVEPTKTPAQLAARVHEPFGE